MNIRKNVLTLVVLDTSTKALRVPVTTLANLLLAALTEIEELSEASLIGKVFLIVPVVLIVVGFSSVPLIGALDALLGLAI